MLPTSRFINTKNLESTNFGRYGYYVQGPKRLYVGSSYYYHDLRAHTNPKSNYTYDLSKLKVKYLVYYT